MAALNLKVDLATFEQTTAAIQSQYETIDQVMNTLSQLVDQLTGSGGPWDSDAGRKYNTEYNNVIRDIVRSQQLLMDHIEDLKTAYNEYSNVGQQIDSAIQGLYTSPGFVS